MSAPLMSAPLLAYASYLPRHRLAREEVGAALGIAAGRGGRVVASFDEDSTTMGVEAARSALAAVTGPHPAPDVYFATTSPAYLDKTNAAAIHVALGLDGTGFAADLAGSARSGLAAWRAAAASGGLAVLADVRTGLPGSADERGGGDGAAAFLFGGGDDGDGGDPIAHVIGAVSRTAEVLDRWRPPGRAHADVWEERFGADRYLPLIRQVAADVLAAAGLDAADHVVLTSPNTAVSKRAASLVKGIVSTGGAPIGHSGTADAGLALAAVLDTAGADQTILVLSAADGCDAVLLRTTDELARRRQPVPLAGQLASGTRVSYPTYLSWRGLLAREAPRRPEPDRPAGPPSARGEQWKFAFTGTRCTNCGFTHLPPARVCRRCAAVDQMAPARLADTPGTITTYTVDRLAFSPSPPLMDAVVDFDGGGRYALEVADADAGDLAVGTRVGLVFRRLYTAGGVHNYFWKARPVQPGQHSHGGTDEQ
jgi:hydroxymethylglutaryl-CoA synthase